MAFKRLEKEEKRGIIHNERGERNGKIYPLRKALQKGAERIRQKKTARLGRNKPDNKEIGKQEAL